MLKHNVNNITFDMLKNVSFHDDNDGVDTFEFKLLDGGIHTVTAESLSKIFALLTCVDFGCLLNIINEREDLNVEMRDMYNDGVREDGVCDFDFYAFGHVCRRYGALRERVTYERIYLKERYGWDVWVSACRVYESLTGTPREWIS